MRTKIFSHHPDSERGQSLVLIAAAMVGLLAFVGLAVDVGFVFARNAQLQAGVDSAALAGVVELMSGNIDNADNQAERFLNSNNIPITDTATMESVTYQTIVQETAYAITVTWPVELYFLKVIGWNEVTLHKSATAAFFPLTDLYAGARVDEGKISTSNQAVFGPLVCTGYGDPFSPFYSPFRPPGTPAGPYVYRYRILIPANYPDNVLRVELFDPDSWNSPTNSATVIRTNYAATHGLPATANMNCPSTARQNPCLIQTGEGALVNPPTVTIDQINPFWFLRIDENRIGNNTDSGCSTPSSYTLSSNTETLYSLSYYRQNNDGTVQNVQLSSYTGKKDNSDNTDLHWVSPGGTPAFDHVYVPTDAGSPKTFELNLNVDTPDMLVEQGTGNRYIYLNVSSLNGATENGFEIWAGPNNYINSVPSQANERNIHVLDSPGAHNSGGAIVFALGTLPMNSNTNNRVDIPLVYINPSYAGETIFVSLFDTDSGTAPPLTFFFDSIAQADWSLSFGNGGTDPDGGSGRCFPICQNAWVNPAYELKVPGDLENCNYSNPTQSECTPFYGGRLVASYDGGESDTYVWQVSLSGSPYLVK